MSQPMRFPRHMPWLLFAPIGFLLLIPFLAPIMAWVWSGITPLQRYYFAVYLDSSVQRWQPGATTSIRWLDKVAIGRKPELAAEPDVLPHSFNNGIGKGAHAPFQLTQVARSQGWSDVIADPPVRVSSAQLADYLENAIYSGESLWRMALQPFLWILLMVFSLLAFRSFRRRDSRQEQRHGRRTKGPEMLSSLRGFANPKGRGIRFRLRFESSIFGWLPFGPGYRIPRKLESSHILLMGDTGSGKSTAIRQILRQLEKRGESAIVYDPAMDFVGEFYDPGRGDLILNPLDDRCPYWRLGDEIDRDETATTMAAALLPEKEYEKPYFTDGPRRILTQLLKRKPQPRDILQMMADPELMAAMVKGTPNAALLDPGAPQQRGGIQSSLNLIADSLELLPEWKYTMPTFSTAEWHRSRTRWVFLTSNAAYREKILPLHSVWLDLFILRMMERCEDPDAKPVWFVLDELASLNKLPQLHTAVTENRKYGNPVVLGFQGRSQLEKRYGQDAEAMLSQPATKVFLKTSEPRAAKWISEAIGEIEVERLKESRSMGWLRSKKSYAMEIATKPLIMASEIAGLAPLCGFIKQENRVVPVRFALAKKRAKQKEFVERIVSKPTRNPVMELPAEDAWPVQTALPLGSPAVKREGFRWDPSQEIE